MKSVKFEKNIQDNAGIREEFYKTFEVKSMASIPLLLVGQRMGLLIATSFISEGDIPFSQYQRDYLNDVGNLVAFSINRIQIQKERETSEHALIASKDRE